MKQKKDYAETFRETTVIETQSQHWGGNRQLYMEGIALEYFTGTDNIKINVSKYEFYSIFRNGNIQYACDSNDYMCNTP